MPRQAGHRLTVAARRRAVRSLKSLVAAGIPDDEARDQIAQQFDVSDRSARSWLDLAYREMAKDAVVDRGTLLGMALRRRRLVMARAAKDGDWRTFLAAADSEAKLLGLNAPDQTHHHVIVAQVRDMTRAVVEVVQEFFADDPAQRARFISALRGRLNTQLAQRPERLSLVIEGDPAPSPNGTVIPPAEAAPPPDLAPAMPAEAMPPPVQTEAPPPEAAPTTVEGNPSNVGRDPNPRTPDPVGDGAP